MHFSTKYAIVVLQAGLLAGAAWGQTAPSGGAQPAGGAQPGVGTQAGQPARPGQQPGQLPAQPGQLPGQRPGQQPVQPGTLPPQPGPVQLPGQPAPPTQVNPNGPQPGGPGQIPSTAGQAATAQAAPGQQAAQPTAQTSPFAALPGSFAPVFQNSGVRKALNISEQQLNQLNQMNSGLLKDYGARVGQLSNLDARERTAGLQKLWGSYRSDFANAAGKIFDQNQMARYRQLDLQRQGLTAFLDPQVQQQLNLTDAQRQQLQTLITTRQEQMNSLRETAQTNRAEATRRYEQLQQQLAKQLGTLLNETQQKSWAEMTGQAHDFGPEFDLTNR
jgi:hypothetical protein